VNFTLRVTLHGAVALLYCGLIGSAQAEDASDIATTITRITSAAEIVNDVDFPVVIQAATGKRVLPLDAVADRNLLDAMNEAFERIVIELNAEAADARPERINELSGEVEDRLCDLIDADPQYDCAVPRTKRGEAQRSGYPDLRIVRLSDMRVFYLDVKLHSTEQRESTFRTFYFEPRNETSKINDDAVHLLVGFEHDGATRASRTFTGWRLVDLSRIQLEFKAEFNAANEELYSPGNIVRAGESAGSKSIPGK
jgi:hypothetical protein